MTVAVYLDLDGTLVEYDQEFEAILGATFEATIGRAEDGWLEAYGEYFWSYFQAFDPDPYQRAVTDLCEMAGLDVDPEAVADRLLEKELAATTVAPSTRRTVERLAADDDFRLGVLTNGVPSVQRPKLERHGLTRHFDAIVVSYEVGAHKPDQRIFETARERIDAEEYVMVGDDFEGDVAPAEDAGFRGIHVDAGLQPSMCVRSLGTVGEFAELL